MRARTLTVLALTALSAAACEDAFGTPDGLTDAEAAEVAEALAATSFDVTGQVALAETSTDDPYVAAALSDTVTSVTEFTTTRSCPAGGQVVLEGTRDRVWVRSTRSGTSDLVATKTHERCARAMRNSDAIITLNGAPNVAIEAHHAWEDGQRSGLQTMSLDGAIDWATDDDRSGTCVIDLDVTHDPEGRTRTVVGQVCDRTIDRTTTWSGTDG